MISHLSCMIAVFSGAGVGIAFTTLVWSRILNNAGTLINDQTETINGQNELNEKLVNALAEANRMLEEQDSADRN